MFIELTDHLRCPAEHEEQFVVLLPEEMRGRQVRSGSLGCPVCGATYRIDAGVLHAGSAPDVESPPTQLGADAQAALLGLGGPGGYVVLVGGAAARHEALAELMEGVAFVLVNPEDQQASTALVSILASNRIPLRQARVRGVMLGEGYGSDEFWVGEAVRVVLPGNRVVGEGTAPVTQELSVAATTEGCWVGFREKGSPAAHS